MFHEQDFESTHLAAILKKKFLDFSIHWTQFSYSGAEPVMTKDSEIPIEGFCAQRPASPARPHQKSQVDYNVVNSIVNLETWAYVLIGCVQQGQQQSQICPLGPKTILQGWPGQLATHRIMS